MIGSSRSRGAGVDVLFSVCAPEIPASSNTARGKRLDTIANTIQVQYTTAFPFLNPRKTPYILSVRTIKMSGFGPHFGELPIAQRRDL